MNRNLWEQGRDYLGWIVSAALAATGYAIRRHRQGTDNGGTLRERWTGSWLSRRLAAERTLATCQEERRGDQASFARQLASREAEIAYLSNRLEKLIAAGDRVLSEADRASAHGSLPLPNAPTPSPNSSASSPATSRTSRAKRPRSTKDRSP